MVFFLSSTTLCLSYDFAFLEKITSRFVSQPALSSAVKKIENELGIKIFDRSSTPVRLTEAGEFYIDAIAKIMAIQKDLKFRLNDIAELKRGRITIGGPNFISSYLFPKIIAAFSEKYPGIDFDVIESNSYQLKRKLIGYEHILLSVPASLEINNELENYRLSAEQITQNEHLKADCMSVSLNRFS